MLHDQAEVSLYLSQVFSGVMIPSENQLSAVVSVFPKKAPIDLPVKK